MLKAVETPLAERMDFHVETPHQESKSLLRFLTCGSVDDGKSTLIGRLLFDAKMVFEDQLAILHEDSTRKGSTAGEIDLALLVDGLEAEREQGITIDVAYRFFSTPNRKFIVADTPGHKQYTRNMATGASTSDLAIVLVDARKGIIDQTRRHSVIASLLGIRHIVLAVNKIDLVGFDEGVFLRIASDYENFAKTLEFRSVVPIPLSARFGDNVLRVSENTPWYDGPSLIAHLENVEVESEAEAEPFRFPVQYVNRPSHDFRGYTGTIASGSIRVDEEVVVAKSGERSRVKRITTYDGDLEVAVKGQAVTLLLADEVELSRGNMLVAPGKNTHVANQFSANVVWFDEQPLLPGRMYFLRTETDEVAATVTSLKHRVNVSNSTRDAATFLEMNEVGVCDFSLQAPIAFDPFSLNRATGSFIVLDRITNATVGAGMILHPLQRADNIHWQALEITKESRAQIKHQKPVVLWFTGLSGSGKSTLANLLEKKLHAAGRHTYILDGDNVRHGLNRDLGFSDENRVENMRRVAEVARLMADAGLIVLVSFISPFRAQRQMVRDLMGEGEFVEIFVDTPVNECIRRDPKGLYAKALRGDIQKFTGVDSPYEPPERADVHLRTEGRSPEELADELERWLRERDYC